MPFAGVPGQGAGQGRNVELDIDPSIPNVTIDVGDIETDDDSGKWNNDGNSLWTDEEFVNRYESDKHIYMMPVSSPSGVLGQALVRGNVAAYDSVAFVQLASPTLLWISDWTVARFGKQPDAPNPYTQGRNWVLLDEHYEPAMVTVADDGTTGLYRLSGTYVYGHRQPSATVIRNINYPRPPWLEDSLDNGRLQPDGSLVDNIINAVNNGGGNIGPAH